MLDSALAKSPAIRTLQSRAAGVLSALGLTANGATIGGALLGVAAGISFAVRWLWPGLMLLSLSAALDALDGTLARQFGRVTLYGGILDLTADRLVEVAILLGITWSRPPLYFPALVLIGSWYLNITVFLAVGAALERRGPKIIEYPPGLLERTEALVFFAVLAMIPEAGPWLCYAFAILEVITAIQRLRFGFRQMTRNP
jgi:archaetidylinositol phosphate synthase